MCVRPGMRNPGTGLLGNTLDVDTATWVRQDSGIGAGLDSFYEYLLKVLVIVPPFRSPSVP